MQYHLRSSPLSLPSQTSVLLTNSTPYSDPGGVHNEGSPQPLSWSRSGSLLSSNSSLPAAANLTGDDAYAGGNGRAWITTLGHEIDTWGTDEMRAHIQGGIAWTLQSSTTASNATSTSGETSGGMSANASIGAKGADGLAISLLGTMILAALFVFEL